LRWLVRNGVTQGRSHTRLSNRLHCSRVAPAAESLTYHGSVLVYAAVLTASAVEYQEVASQQSDARNTFQTTLGLLVTVVGVWVLEAVYLIGAAVIAIAASAAGVTWQEARELVFAKAGCGRCASSTGGVILCGAGADTRLPQWGEVLSGWDGGHDAGEGASAWTQPLLPDATASRVAKGLSVGLGLSGVLSASPASLNAAAATSSATGRARDSDDPSTAFLSRVGVGVGGGSGDTWRAHGAPAQGRLARVEIERDHTDAVDRGSGGVQLFGEPPAMYGAGVREATRETASESAARWVWWWHVRRSAAWWMTLCDATNQAQCAALVGLCIWGAVQLRQSE